jgi:hypothetical protein
MKVIGNYRRVRIQARPPPRPDTGGSLIPLSGLPRF